MDDNNRRILTEKLLREIYFTEKLYIGRKYNKPITSRHFTTWDDLGAVFKALVDKGLWTEFYDFSERCWHKSNDNDSFMLEDEAEEETLSRWLFYNPERFCTLCAEFMKKGE